MESQRDVSRKTFRFKMMVFMLTLTFPRATAGATFFHQHDENKNYTLICSQWGNKSDTKYYWYRGYGSPPQLSLLRFELTEKDTKETFCSEKSHSHYMNKTLYIPHGGIFACAPRTEKPTCPLFSDKNDCSHFDFFIVATRNRTAEEKAFWNVSEQSKLQVIAEEDPLNLTCELQIMDKATEVTLYWFKETAPAICLFSASNEGNFSKSIFSDDDNCCVDAAIKQRRTSYSVNFDGRWLHHNLTIVNASSSDSGSYLCVVAIWSSKRIWMIARNVSVEVENSMQRHESADDKSIDDESGGSDSRSTNVLPISLGVIGGVILIAGIIGVLYWKKKAKGNPVKERPRNQTEVEMEEDDCSPYAVSSRKDLEKMETMYSVVTFPPESRQGASTSSDVKTASRSGEKLHTVYALLSK